MSNVTHPTTIILFITHTPEKFSTVILLLRSYDPTILHWNENGGLVQSQADKSSLLLLVAVYMSFQHVVWCFLRCVKKSQCGRVPWVLALMFTLVKIGWNLKHYQ